MARKKVSSIGDLLQCRDCGNTIEETVQILMNRLMQGEHLDTSELELLQQSVQDWTPDELFRCPDCLKKLKEDKEKLMQWMNAWSCLNWKSFPHSLLK